MKINIQSKCKNILAKRKQYYGLYSPNKTIIFSILFLFFISLFSGTKITQFTSSIKPGYIKNLFTVLSQPLVDFSKKIKTNNYYSKLRTQFLEITDLKHNTHWDNYYFNVLSYKENNTPIQNTPFTTDQSKNIKNEFLISSFKYTKKHPLRILFIGDSEVECFSSGFLRIISEKSPFEIKSYSIPSSGFIRTDYYNWPAKFTTIFNEAKENNIEFDCVILLLGMNDNQNFFDGEGHLFRTETYEWQQAYIQKIKTHLTILSQNVEKIYWLGLPVVRDKTLNKEISFIENAQIEAAKILNTKGKIEKISVREIAPGTGVPYTPIIQTGKGRTLKLMRSDGTHYTISGGEYIMRKIMKRFFIDFSIEPLD